LSRSAVSVRMKYAQLHGRFGIPIKTAQRVAIVPAFTTRVLWHLSLSRLGDLQESADLDGLS